jgi:hypothetical protein
MVIDVPLVAPSMYIQGEIMKVFNGDDSVIHTSQPYRAAKDSSPVKHNRKLSSNVYFYEESEESELEHVDSF